VQCSASTTRKSYAGYQIVRLYFSSAKHAASPADRKEIHRQIEELQSVAKKFRLSIRATNQVEGWMDVLIPPLLNGLANQLFPGFRLKVKVPDVQEMIDENERQRILFDKPDDIFSNYQPYNVISDWLTTQQKQQPNLAKKFVLGQTSQNQDIYGLYIGAPQPNKPMIYIECGIHACEWIAPTHCLWFIDQILNVDPDRSKLLTNFTFAIIPVLNVDGYMYTFNGDRLWRKNRQPNDGSSCVGTDLNRNWGYQWQEGDDPCSDTYPGTAAFTGPEITSVRSFLQNATNIVSFWDFHSYGGLWMCPWAYTCDEKPKDYTLLSNEMAAATTAIQAVNGNSYNYGDICDTIYQAYGSSVDFAYGTVNIVHSFASETYGDDFVLPTDQIVPLCTEIWAGVKTTLVLIASGQK